MLRRCENNAKAVETPLYHQCARDLATALFALFALQQSQPVQQCAAVERQLLWLEFVAYMRVPSR